MTSAVRSTLATLGLLVAALGAVLIARPFTSIETLAWLLIATLAAMSIGQLAGAPRPWTWPTRLGVLAWLTPALVLASQRDLPISTVAIIVGSSVLAEGVLRVAQGLRDASGPQSRQFAHLAFGLSGILLGVLTLSWPDITVLLVAVLFGIRALWFGLALFWTGVRGTFDEAEPFEPGSPRRITTTTASAVGLALALAVGSVSYYVHEGRPVSLGALKIPSEVPKEPGRLISAEAFDRDVPRGLQTWRILYTTTRDDGQPAVSTGLIIVKDQRPSEPQPVIAWAHGTTGIAPSCAPSNNVSPLYFFTIPGLDEALEAGWAVVATDYIGLGTPGPHPYLIGQGEGRSVLDSVRAAHEFSELDLADKTAVWGHSQGGGAALWAGILAPTYTPELNIVGVAGIAPATDLIGLVNHVVSNPFGTLLAAYVIDAFSEAYPDVSFDTYIRPGAQAAMRTAAGLCLADQAELVSVAQDDAFKEQVYAASPTTGALAKRLEQNMPSAPIPAPTLIVQGETDVLVLPSLQAAFAAARCTQAGSGPLDYRTYPERDHTSIISPSSAMIDDLLTWTKDRFEGTPATSTC